MSYRLKCYTLFDITPTGVTNRRKPAIINNEFDWQDQRNTQCNYDTIIQILSLRSQPEDVTTPEQEIVIFNDCTLFGFLYANEDSAQSFWSFEFTIPHKSVFNDGYSELGSLLYDCERVPMIRTSKSWDKLPTFLDTTPELRNIHFEVLTNE